VAALLAAAELADHAHEADVAAYLRQTADSWNASIEQWTYVHDTPLAKRVGVEGYYVWMAPREVGGGDAARVLRDSPAAEVVSPDPLALVRFGLRRADDPRILNTIRVIDAVLKVDTPQGPAWHRYIGDQYGEHDDG
jgi:glucoamylase